LPFPQLAIRRRSAIVLAVDSDAGSLEAVPVEESVWLRGLLMELWPWLYEQELVSDASVAQPRNTKRRGMTSTRLARVRCMPCQNAFRFITDTGRGRPLCALVLTG
jgi:hypothetical protein